MSDADPLHWPIVLTLADVGNSDLPPAAIRLRALLKRARRSYGFTASWTPHGAPGTPKIVPDQAPAKRIRRRKAPATSSTPV